jgi:hypothetical protein
MIITIGMFSRKDPPPSQQFGDQSTTNHPDDKAEACHCPVRCEGATPRTACGEIRDQQ